jgi:hypothetical protein
MPVRAVRPSDLRRVSTSSAASRRQSLVDAGAAAPAEAEAEDEGEAAVAVATPEAVAVAA